MFFLFNRSKRIGGEIGYYNLQDWWLNKLTESERQTIEGTYVPMGTGDGGKPLTEGNIASSSQTKIMFLVILAGWFNNPRNRELANKILEKAEEASIENPEDILSRHFLYSEMISIYYPQRDVNEMFEKSVEACRKQIELAPMAKREFLKEYPKQDLPSHAGYNQLRIILKKQGKYSEAIELCQQAKKQGWSGVWEKNIEELKRMKTKRV
jgi:tetratricopeptide (TPR) repeat protein